MKPDQLRDAREAIGWSIRSTAKRIGVEETNIRRWEAGSYPAPAAYAAWIGYLAKIHRANPPPKLS